MSRRRGVSADEKKARLLNLFHEKKEFFQLKELETIASKEKGIVAQTVKDVLQSLVDDNLVETDKIGTSTYYWSFPSHSIKMKKMEIARLEKEIENTRKALFETKDKIIEAKVGREDMSKRTHVIEENKVITAENEYLLKELQKYKQNDSADLEKMLNDTEVAKEAANRWTDNISSLKSWCKNKFFIEEDVINKQFGIPEDLDYIE
ncbi:meiotic nuclear division protein 1 homolog [Cimex lectularius]|uniref:Meiotic nuclear division protein 1 homolog n=1 Tax=Cimex lectularius TaxID=79782 RepID=A0A8I6RVG2_CIMLE|nr:meiotic nuclear division protein 1 homolog [Cimex lectularius]XP_014251586.1 meiotic nuclear division protein 1 homolog [Cimex lectularius]